MIKLHVWVAVLTTALLSACGNNATTDTGATDTTVRDTTVQDTAVDVAVDSGDAAGDSSASDARADAAQDASQDTAHDGAIAQDPLCAELNGQCRSISQCAYGTGRIAVTRDTCPNAGSAGVVCCIPVDPLMDEVCCMCSGANFRATWNSRESLWECAGTNCSQGPGPCS